jgi:hypothetical protein
MTAFVIGCSRPAFIETQTRSNGKSDGNAMSHHGRMAGVMIAALAAPAAAALLGTAPDAARWALLICSLGFVGATLRLRRLDAGL